jgi:hypothetical protein
MGMIIVTLLEIEDNRSRRRFAPWNIMAGELSMRGRLRQFVLRVGPWWAAKHPDRERWSASRVPPPRSH